jgi:hypothetical protein
MGIEEHSPKWLLNEIRNAESDAHALFKIIEFQKAITEQYKVLSKHNLKKENEELRELVLKVDSFKTTLSMKEAELFGLLIEEQALKKK